MDIDFFNAIHEYSQKYTMDPSQELNHIERETHLKTLAPRMVSGPLQGQFIRLLSQIMQPDSILEIGTFTGYATLCLAEGLSPQGKIITIESNDELENMLLNHFEKSKFKEQIELIIGNALEIIPTLDMMFDIIYLDAGKKDYLKYYDLILEQLKPNGIIIADNVLWSGKVLDTIQNNDEHTVTLHEFNEKVYQDERVDNILLPLRDGLHIIRKK